MTEQDMPYIGEELELFQLAGNWRSYYFSFFRSILKGKVLEVGAGLGGTTRYLCDGSQSRWVCLEPDSSLLDKLKDGMGRGVIPALCEPRRGTVKSLAEDEMFDAIIYIDVLEHIEDDRGELVEVTKHLSPGGHLIVLSPAHQWLFSAMDHAVGHFRRYTRRTLAEAAPPDLDTVKLIYLDCTGMLLNFLNRHLIADKHPSKWSVLIWDRLFIPFSRVIDPLFSFALGKSILGIWRKR